MEMNMSDKITPETKTASPARSDSNMRVMKSIDLQRARTSAKVARVIGLAMVYTFLIVIAVVILFPFYWMIISSLKTLDEYRLSVPTLFPETIVFGNYAEAFTQANLGRLFLNTVYVGLVSTIFSLIITVLSAFAFARSVSSFAAALSALHAVFAAVLIAGITVVLRTVISFIVIRIF
jgi:ABC-type glycerol-3-phosphate transport system permease component